MSQSSPPEPPPTTSDLAAREPERPSWPLTALALIIVISALTSAVLTMVLVTDHAAAATTAGLIGTTGITTAATLLRRA
ncbi:hypothetical protein [Streptomyces sp. MAI_2237]